MNTDAAINLITQHGVYGLGGSDGCRCSNFMVHGFYVDLSCHKSSGGVKWSRWGVLRVYSHHMDVTPDDLAAVASAVKKSIRDNSWDAEYQDDYWTLRFCEWRQDKEQICVYCGKPREDERGYLCNKCLHRRNPMGGNIADQRDYRGIEQRVVHDLPIPNEIHLHGENAQFVVKIKEQ